MKYQNSIEYCKQCELEISGAYCSQCGNAKDLKRIDEKYIINEVTSVLNFDRGILYTIKELVLRPGVTVRKFIAEDRNRLVKPVIFIIISSLLYSVLRGLLQFEDGYVYYDNSTVTSATVIFEWIQNNYGYGNLIMGVFIALWTKLLFRKYDYNFYEILILLCFVMGIGMIILAVFGIVQGLTNFKVLQFGGMLFFVYCGWAIGQFFDGKKVSSYLKAVLAYVLGFVSFSIGVLLIGYLVDLML